MALHARIEADPRIVQARILAASWAGWQRLTQLRCQLADLAGTSYTAVIADLLGAPPTDVRAQPRPPSCEADARFTATGATVAIQPSSLTAAWRVRFGAAPPPHWQDGPAQTVGGRGQRTVYLPFGSTSLAGWLSAMHEFGHARAPDDVTPVGDEAHAFAHEHQAIELASWITLDVVRAVDLSANAAVRALQVGRQRRAHLADALARVELAAWQGAPFTPPCARVPRALIDAPGQNVSYALAWAVAA